MKELNRYVDHTEDWGFWTIMNSLRRESQFWVTVLYYKKTFPVLVISLVKTTSFRMFECDRKMLKLLHLRRHKCDRKMRGYKGQATTAMLKEPDKGQLNCSKRRFNSNILAWEDPVVIQTIYIQTPSMHPPDLKQHHALFRHRNTMFLWWILYLCLSQTHFYRTFY